MWGDQKSDALVAIGGGGINFGGRYPEFVGFSHESEHDLEVMVSDFLENGSGGADSWYGSDSDSTFSDLAYLSDKISLYRLSVDQYERDLLSVVHSLILSINETKHQPKTPETCNASCIRFSLVKLLQSSGYDATIIATKWQGFGKIPGGEHEFVAVSKYSAGGCSERYVVDIDFRSHFEIAKAVKSYNALLNSLPPVYVGSKTKLKQYLQTMVEAAKCSLRQNSMPLPPWRSLAYLEAKWEFTNPIEHNVNGKIDATICHQHCLGLLRRIKSCIQSEIKAKGLIIPISTEKNWRLKTP